MCYINGVKVSLEEYISYKQQQKELKQLQQALLMQPAKRGFDYSDWPIIKPTIDGKDWDVVAMEWGFLPNYLINDEDVIKFRKGYKDHLGEFKKPYLTFNAMGEEILDKRKMYRQAALSRRCLAISSGFYEHRHVIDKGKKGQPLKTPGKYPYRIHLKSKENFLIAAIWNEWTNQDTGETKDTFAILTTEANSLMSQVHNSKNKNDQNRMPVILPTDLADEWTNPDLTESKILELATYQFPASEMQAYPVSKDFLKNDDPTEPFSYEILEELV